MFDVIRNNQLNIMLILCSICAMMAILVIFTKFLPPKRKGILLTMELVATFLLAFDRLAYIYSGNESSLGWVMVRLSNFMVFFLTSGVVFCFNLYISDLLIREVKLKSIPRRLNLAGILSILGMFLVIISVFTGLFYTFDEHNRYRRAPGFLLCYIVPVVCPLIQFSVIQKYRKNFSNFIFIALILYIFIPIGMGILQIFTYGISIVNMAMVMVSVSLYIFSYLDINAEVVKLHLIEMNELKEEHKNMQQLFSQTANAFVTSLEKLNPDNIGLSTKTAALAKKIAEKSGKSEEECEQAYYTALLYNAGITAVPAEILEKDNPSEEEEALIKKLPVISSEILSSIKEFPYLSKAARYVHERYDGKGYPEGLKGEDIPQASRITAISASYFNLSTKRKNKNPLPAHIIREEFIKEAGLKYDPVFANSLVTILDSIANAHNVTQEEPLESEITCKEYRSSISVGIPVVRNFTEISFRCKSKAEEGQFSSPSLVLFDSYDMRSHANQKAINAYHYIEYGEVWFDGHYISTSARNIEVRINEKSEEEIKNSGDKDLYTIKSARFEDHIILNLENYEKKIEVILALPDVSKSAYIGITGENIYIYDIKAVTTENQIAENAIPRIAEKISYINRLESDLPNIQITSPRGTYTQPVEVQDNMSIFFHTMSLPEASLVWHCPYILLYYSEDSKIGGPDYREYAVVKLNGEDDGSKEFSENNFTMTKKENFKNWNEWKNLNKSGYECRIDLIKKGKVITMFTENLGVELENKCTILDDKQKVYIALTGDQCALTDIRIR